MNIVFMVGKFLSKQSYAVICLQTDKHLWSKFGCTRKFFLNLLLKTFFLDDYVKYCYICIHSYGILVVNHDSGRCGNDIVVVLIVLCKLSCL